MKIHEAAEHLEKGNKIRRKIWPEDHYLEMDHKRVVWMFVDNPHSPRSKWSRPVHAELSAEEKAATDWELYDEYS